MCSLRSAYGSTPAAQIRCNTMSFIFSGLFGSYLFTTQKNNKIILENLLTNAFRYDIILSVAGNKALARFQASDGSLAQLGEHLPYKQRVTGSSPVASTIGQCDRFRSTLTGYGRVVQLVRTLACHARGRGFEPHLGRHMPL